MTKNEPFEAYRRRREVEAMESGFHERAAERRQRLEEILEQEDDTVEFERKVLVEMEDFLHESSKTAEAMLIELGSGEEGGPVDSDDLRNELENILSGIAPEVTEEAAPETGEEDQESDEDEERPRDLQSTLERIRRCRPEKPSLPRRHAMPENEAKPARLRPNRGQILDSFDQTCSQVSDLLRRRMDEEEIADEAEEVPDSEEVAHPIPDRPAAEDELHEALETEDNESSEITESEPVGVETAESQPVGAEISESQPVGVETVESEPVGAETAESQAVGAETVESESVTAITAPEEAATVVTSPEEAEVQARQGTRNILERAWQDVQDLNLLARLLVARGIVTEEEIAASDGAEVVREPPTDPRQAVPRLVRDIYRLNQLKDALLRKGTITTEELESAGGR